MFENFKKSRLIVWLADFLLVGLMVFAFGFEHYDSYNIYTELGMPCLVIVLLGVNFYQFKTSSLGSKMRKVAKINLVLLLSLVALQSIFMGVKFKTSILDTYMYTRYVLQYGLFIYFFIRLTFLVRKIYSAYFNPALLFVSSFALVALSGALLLKLPAATTQGISFIDALFTATSAVAVTGLVVVDTATAFTTFGQVVIIGLIQIGGLGMLTFTAFFAYFFKTGSTFRESLYMKDILGDDKVNNVMGLAMQIVLFSLVVELVGALFIYHSLSGSAVFDDRVFAAAFHAVSAYCNAGFSLASQGLMEEGLQYNYYLQWIIMGLIVFGGLGYGIASNFIQYLRKFTLNLFRRKEKFFLPRVITLNTKIVVYMTIILVFGGAFIFLITEHTNVLTLHETIFGKFTTAMFSSVTARTAGFNTIDYAMMTVPGLLIMILLMWIGASPGSTGGGIKTTTFALATINVFSLAKGKENIEIGTRRVPKEAIRKAFAIIVLSLISIGISILLLLIFDPQLSLLQVSFETFSAYSTVGLSMGITADLSVGSKLVLICLMFLGRIGILNLLMGLVKRRKTTQYMYPKENIIIT